MPKGKPRLGRRAPIDWRSRDRISRAASLRPPMSEETKAKISAAKKGRKNTPEHNAKIAAARRRSAGRNDIVRVEARAQLRRKRWSHLGATRWRKDLLNAALMKDKELYDDVAASYGWRSHRKVFRGHEEGLVSCGWSAVQGRVLWDPAQTYYPKGPKSQKHYSLVDRMGRNG